MIALGSSFCTDIVTYTPTDGTISNRIRVYTGYDGNQPSVGNAPNAIHTLANVQPRLNSQVEYTNANDNGNDYTMHRLNNIRDIDHSNSYDVSAAAMPINQRI